MNNRSINTDRGVAPQAAPDSPAATSLGRGPQACTSRSHRGYPTTLPLQAQPAGAQPAQAQPDRLPAGSGKNRESLIRDLEIHYRDISSLKPRSRNPRTHSPKQIRQIAESIEQFGFTSPILLDDQDGVVAGHGRIEAAKLLRLERVPTICLEQMTEAEIRAYVIADNRLAENAGWDETLLAIEFKYLSDLELDFDLTITGFETAEIDLLIQGVDTDPDPADEVPDVDPTSPPVTQPGDLWLLGLHRVFCGDATQPASFQRLMAGDSAQMIFTDPPYNVPIEGHVSGLGRVKHEDFAMACGEMSAQEFSAFLKGIFEHLIAHSVDGAIHFVCMDWRHLAEILSAGGAYREFKNLCVWSKDNGGMGSLYRSQHELILVFKSGTAPHINNVELGRHGRYRTNVWSYPGVNTLRDGRLEELEWHPTVKPVALVADAILDCSNRSGIILDCFGGSGTTLIAAEQSGRRAYLMELEPAYVDVTLMRYRQLTGNNPVHQASGLTFSELTKRGDRLLAQTPDPVTPESSPDSLPSPPSLQTSVHCEPLKSRDSPVLRTTLTSQDADVTGGRS